MQKIDEINEEEAAYGWEMSQYSLRKQCADKLQPFKKLFDAGQEFMDKHDLWMHTQVGTYEPESIDDTIGNLYRAVVKLEKQFSDSPNTQRLATGVSSYIFCLRSNFVSNELLLHRLKILLMSSRLTCL